MLKIKKSVTMISQSLTVVSLLTVFGHILKLLLFMQLSWCGGIGNKVFILSQSNYIEICSSWQKHFANLDHTMCITTNIVSVQCGTCWLLQHYCKEWQKKVYILNELKECGVLGGLLKHCLLCLWTNGIQSTILKNTSDVTDIVNVQSISN